MLITLNMVYDSEGMLYISNNNKSLGEASVTSEQDVYECMLSALDQLELGEDDVILCALIYDGDVTLSRDYNTVNSAVERVRRVYKSFYCTYIQQGSERRYP